MILFEENTDTNIAMLAEVHSVLLRGDVGYKS